MKLLTFRVPGIPVLYALAFCVILFFYPLIALLNSAFDLQTNMISIIYRGLALLISTLIIGKEGILSNNLTLQKGFFFLFLFWCYYLMKLLIDLYLFNLVPDLGVFTHNRTFYFLESIGMCFIPMIATFIMARRVDTALLHKLLLVTFSLINVLLIVSFLSKYGLDIAKYSTMRLSLFSTTSNVQILNSISIGIYAGFLFISLLFARLNLLIRIPLMAVALTNLILSASIGPFLGIVAIILVKFYFGWRKMKKIYFFLAISAFAVFVVFIISNVTEEFYLVKRLMNIDSNESAIVRGESISRAFEQMKSNIILGTHYFTVADGSSPHNVFVDIVLSTGLLGLAIVVYPILRFLIFFIRDHGSTLILSITFFTFILAQTSGYVFGMTDFWPLLAFCLGLEAKAKLDEQHLSNKTLASVT